MATRIPARLKMADLTRFVIRAAQLETAKPVISYWCEYWIVNQILAKGLHNGDAETLNYTTTLMDKLEQIKAENATNDAIIDDVAGQAYVEQFGLETFQRADRAVQADKVTKQTADTFQASITFLELFNIWGVPDAETQAKIKYAKWNAVRIAKALKEGKDPNSTNPKIEVTEPEIEEDLPALDPNDPEVLNFGEPTKPHQPSVEEVPDEQHHIEAQLAMQSSIDRSLHPSAQVSARGSPIAKPAGGSKLRDGSLYTATQDDNVSPLEQSPNDRHGSAGGGYFPEVQTFTSGLQDSTIPTALPDDLPDLGLPNQPTIMPGQAPGLDFPPFSSLPANETAAPLPQDLYRQAPPPSKPPPPESPYYAPSPQQPVYQPPPQQYSVPPVITPMRQAPPRPVVAAQLNTDDVSIAKAQKHARWAISALNFEDADTAVKELRAALKTLGA